MFKIAVVKYTNCCYQPYNPLPKPVQDTFKILHLFGPQPWATQPPAKQKKIGGHTFLTKLTQKFWPNPMSNCGGN
jgi:hypothetical protein